MPDDDGHDDGGRCGGGERKRLLTKGLGMRDVVGDGDLELDLDLVFYKPEIP